MHAIISFLSMKWRTHDGTNAFQLTILLYEPCWPHILSVVVYLCAVCGIIFCSFFQILNSNFWRATYIYILYSTEQYKNMSVFVWTEWQRGRKREKKKKRTHKKWKNQIYRQARLSLQCIKSNSIQISFYSMSIDTILQWLYD